MIERTKMATFYRWKYLTKSVVFGFVQSFVEVQLVWAQGRNSALSPEPAVAKATVACLPAYAYKYSVPLKTLEGWN